MEYARSVTQIEKPATTPVAANGARIDHTVWAQLTPIRPTRRTLRDNRIVANSSSDSASVAFDVLRTKILKTVGQKNWKTIAITSPTEGCGKSVVAANLAFSLARTSNIRVALLELDLRRPRMRNMLGISSPLAVERFLRGTALVGETFGRWEQSLAIAAASTSVMDSTELLQMPSTKAAIAKVKELLQPNVILFDLPPVFANGDLLAFAENVDCALIVAAAGSTTLAEIEAAEAELASQTDILGIVLNKCRYNPRKGGY